MTIQRDSRQRLSELDALRGLAATAVLLFHLTYYDDKLGLAPFALTGGHYGVELFFIISGFVIFMTLLGSSSIRDFVASRVARLYPAYWCAVLITALFVILLEGEPPSSTSIAANLTMFQVFLKVPDLDGSYWTLAVELEFYVGIGLIFALGLLKRIDGFCIAYLIVAHFFQFAIIHWSLGPILARDGFPISARYGCIQYGGFFIIGICLFRLRAQQGSWTTYVALSLAILYSAWGGPPSSMSPEGLQYFWITCLLTLVMWLAVNGHARVLRWQPLVLLGGISYPLYLVHQRIGAYLMGSLHGHGAPGWVAIVGATIGVTGLAVAIHVWIETPSRRIVRQLVLGNPLTVLRVKREVP
jgi:peptidoglycan/LPS O-acetylase OafA/YrhL